jgi:hypothetical protein
MCVPSWKGDWNGPVESVCRGWKCSVRMGVTTDEISERVREGVWRWKVSRCVKQLRQSFYYDLAILLDL